MTRAAAGKATSVPPRDVRCEEAKQPNTEHLAAEAAQKGSAPAGAGSPFLTTRSHAPRRAVRNGAAQPLGMVAVRHEGFAAGTALTPNPSAPGGAYENRRRAREGHEEHAGSQPDHQFCRM
ncbi:hypothetical protein GCM10010121_078910 [Streptomyces brasiliensis]|uniref:Uncharacterized protein n=1 Tax=Streptomyces brasiliensis TaxID=1954 RepID=A0A917P2I2_9ACTN|nr:hypothetical protein GCM10010121_078910 [Streptomyces brasiliensis]